MFVSQSIDQLNIDTNLVGNSLDAAFQNVGDAELLCDLRKIFRRALEMLRRGARNHFEIGDLGQPGEDFILHAFGEISIIGIATEIVEGQDRDRFRRSPGRTGTFPSSVPSQKEQTDGNGDADCHDINPAIFLRAR